jgi:hypothetical protein
VKSHRAALGGLAKGCGIEAELVWNVPFARCLLHRVRLETCPDGLCLGRYVAAGTTGRFVVTSVTGRYVATRGAVLTLWPMWRQGPCSPPTPVNITMAISMTRTMTMIPLTFTQRGMPG